MRLLELGLLAIEPIPELGPVDDFAVGPGARRPDAGSAAGPPGGDQRGADRAARRAAAQGSPAPVRQVRESDGLEPILRLGALWQRVGAEPLRQTNQGTLYKRDRDRLTEDPVLACSIADALKPLAPLARAVARAGLPVRSGRTRPARRAAARRVRPSSGPKTRSTCPR